MVVSEQLKKQIIIEILALIFLMGVIVYAVFAIQKSKGNKVTSVQGMVIVVDDSELIRNINLSVSFRFCS